MDTRANQAGADAGHGISLSEAFRVWLRVASLSFGGPALDFDRPVLTSVDVPALVLSIAAATAIFRFKLGMLTVLAGSCAAGVALRLVGVI